MSALSLGCTSRTLTRYARALALALAAIVALALAPSAFAQQGEASLVMQVDRKEITLQDTVELTIRVEGTFDAFDQPEVDGFSVENGATSTQIRGRRRVITQSFTLTPQRTGKLTIGLARLRNNGQVVAEAPAIEVVVREQTVVDAATAQDLSRMAGTPIFVRYALPRTRFYVGEPFPMALELWLQDGLRYPGVELQSPAKLDGLFTEQLPDQRDATPVERVISGQRYRMSTLATVIATPFNPGKVLIDSAVLRVSVAQDDWSLTAKKTSRGTQAFELEIRDIPKDNRPNGYSAGNLGTYSMEVRLTDDQGQQPSHVRTGQRLVLRAVVSGRGNLSALRAPKIEAPGFEVSPLTSTGEDRIEKGPTGITGQRVFQWLVTPQKSGNTKAPSLVLGWWDPEAERFQTATGGQMPLEVTGSTLSTSQTDATTIGEDVGPIAEKAALTGSRSTPPAESPVYWIAMGVPLALFFVVEARWRRRAADKKNPGQRLSRGAGANAKKRLRAAEQALKDGLVKDFYGQLSRTLTSYLEERANIPATGMTHDQIRAAALGVGYPNDLVDQIIVWMENCDFARFAPSGSAAAGMKEAHGHVAGIIDRLDPIQPERRP